MTTPRTGPLGILSATGNMLFRAANGEIDEVDTAGAEDGEVLTRASGLPVWAAGPTPPIMWGNGSVFATTTDRFLSPWYSDIGAPTAAIQWRVPRAGIFRNMRVRQNITAGNGNDIVYTLRVGGVASTLTVTVASTDADGTDLVNTVTVAAGDLVDIIVEKALDVGTTPEDITVTMELLAA